MSQIANRPAEVALSSKNMKILLANPSSMVPPEVRPALLECWATHRHLNGMDTAFPIAAPLSVWINRHGLHVDDASKILLDMQEPGKFATHTFASELIAMIAGLVKSAIDRRRFDDEAKRERDERAAWEAKCKAERESRTPEQDTAEQAKMQAIRDAVKRLGQMQERPLEEVQRRRATSV